MGEDDRLANILGAFALGVVDELEMAAERVAGRSGAGPAALVALSDLLAGRSVDDLRRAVGLTHSGGVRTVDRLVADGLAERRPGYDGRSVSVGLTPRGRRLAGQVRESRSAALADLLAVLDEGERADLTRILEKLVGTVVDRRLDARAAGRDPGGWLCRMCDAGACQRASGRCPAATAAQASVEGGRSIAG